MSTTNDNISTQLRSILNKYWGYTDFREGQEHIIRSIMEGRDTLALMPTGGGKSLTYQIPTLAKDGLCLVVTPLIALMKDQVDHLRRLGISATAVHSGLSYNQIDIALDNCVYGDVKFLYISPERLATELFRMRVQRMNISLIAVDEAHCISQWGYDFRPSYLRIAEVREKMPDVPILALTASATDMVAEDIMRHLQFHEPHIVRSSFARPNLSYAVRHTDDKNAQLLRIINNVKGSGIVYLRSRDGVEQIAKMLQESGISASFYHAGLPSLERSLRQDEWIQGKVRVMVSTNAFGMGIDKSDARFVVHYSMCDSLESYYQEAGRAGRDGQRSYAVLLVASDDDSRIVKHFKAEFPPLEEVKSIYEKICSYLQVAIGDGLYASYIFNIYEFCAREKLYIGKVKSAIKLLQQNGYLTLIEQMENPAKIIFCVSRDDLYKIRIVRKDLDNLIYSILRLYNGVFTEFRSINEQELALATGYSSEHIHELLKRMWQMRIIRYIPANNSPMIFFDEERLPTNDIYISPETYIHRRKLSEERFGNMLNYSTNEQECRSVILQRYFGDKDATPCGICDICLERRRAEKQSNRSIEERVEEQTLMLIRKGEYTPRELMNELKSESATIAKILDKLLSQEKISLTNDGKLIINE